MSEPPNTSSSIVLRDPHHHHHQQPLFLSPPPITTTSSSSSLPRDYRKGNWTLHETLVLITAKKMDDERRSSGHSSKPSSSSTSSPSTSSSCKTAELRWKWVENYCWSHDCHRSQNQCNDKWDNLLRDYKKVRDYEARPMHPKDRPSYWQMEKHERKERNLPSNLLLDVFQALHEVVNRRYSQKSAASAGGASGAAAAPTAVIARPMAPPLPPPPQPQPLSPPPPPPQQQPVSVEITDTSETEGGGSEKQDSDTKKRRKVRSIGSSVVRGASVLARAILACEEKREKRHRNVLEMEERKLQMEENRTEMNRQGIAGLISAVNNLSNAIQALVSDRHDTR